MRREPITISAEKEQVILAAFPVIQEKMKSIEGDFTKAIFMMDGAGGPFMKIANIPTAGGVQWGIWDLGRGHLTCASQYGTLEEIFKVCQSRLYHHYRDTPFGKFLKNPVYKCQAVVMQAPDNRGHYSDFTAV